MRLASTRVRVHRTVAAAAVALGLFQGAPALACSCVGTYSGQPACEEAADALTYLRAVPTNPGRDGRIIGLVLQEDRDPARPGRRTPFAGARIRAEGQGLARTATSGADGKYEIRLPVGRYRVSAEVGTAGRHVDALVDGDVELKDARGCAVADFSVELDEHVLGRVLSGTGQPVPELTVELTPVREAIPFHWIGLPVITGPTADSPSRFPREPRIKNALHRDGLGLAAACGMGRVEGQMLRLECIPDVQ